MSPIASRRWFAATAACAVLGIAISVITAINNTGGHFHPGVSRAFNTFTFFTIDSNLLVAAGALLLALRLDRRDARFAALRLTGLVAITITGIVYHVALRGVFDLATTWDHVGNELVHTVVPIMAVAGWLLAGPRGLCRSRIVWMTLIFPAVWLTFTFVRGAIAHWYPYPFLDVTQLGYGRALINSGWVAVLLLGLAAGASWLDARLPAAGQTRSGSGSRLA
jgi:hypothetical protein